MSKQSKYTDEEWKQYRREEEHKVRDRIEPIRLALLGRLTELTGRLWCLTIEVSLWNWIIICKCNADGLDPTRRTSDGYLFQFTFSDSFWERHIEYDDFIDRINYCVCVVLTELHKEFQWRQKEILEKGADVVAKENTDLLHDLRNIYHGDYQWTELLRS